jgi:IS1 family transposase
VQFDEKWSFVGKKEKHCDPENPADVEYGDQWEHVAFDPEHRLVVSVVVGKRTQEHAQLLVEDFRARTGGRVPELMTSDEHAAYPGAIVAVYGEQVVPPRTGKPGRPAEPYQVVPKGLRYATVHKRRERNRVVGIETRVVFGTKKGVKEALAASAVSRAVNTSYLERQHGTDRHRNARKGRKTYRFSKEWEVHQAVTRFTLYSYNFCWAVRTLREKGEDGTWQRRTPAMSAGLANHVWSIEEWVTFPALQR